MAAACTGGGEGAAHRPQLAHAALQQRVVHSEWQPRLAAAAHRGDRTELQRAVEVGRVHLRALAVRARPQPSACGCVGAAPRLGERAIAGPVLQPC